MISIIADHCWKQAGHACSNKAFAELTVQGLGIAVLFPVSPAQT
jgi:hypothetical protein